MTLGISIQCNNAECRYARVFYFLITIMLCHYPCVSHVIWVMLSDKCHYAKCHYAECCGAVKCMSLP